MSVGWPTKPTGFEDDPLADVDPSRPCRCEGSGWITVRPEYAERHATRADGTMDEVRRLSLLNSVYPCKTHRPAQFFRWLEGHYAAGHDPGNCDECREVLGKRMRKHHD